MVVLIWLVRFLGVMLIGSIVLAGLGAVGLYQAAELVERVQELLAIDVLNFLFWPFDMIEFAWFEITLRERAYVALVWALMIVPALRNVFASSNPDMIPAAALGDIRFTIINFPFSLLSGLIFAILLGIICFVLPDFLSTLALIGWMSFTHWTILSGSIGFLFTPIPEEEDDAVAYNYFIDKYTVILAAKTYGEMAVGATVVYWLEALFFR